LPENEGSFRWTPGHANVAHVVDITACEKQTVVSFASSWQNLEVAHDRHEEEEELLSCQRFSQAVSSS
jgi:hypothetical protein